MPLSIQGIRRFVAGHPRGALLVGLGVLLALRRPDAFLHPQFWAEDGMFYVDALVRKGSSLLLPYAGYLHFAPRLTALLAAVFDPLYAPTITTAVAFGLTLVVLARLLSSRLALPHQGWLPLAVICLPDTREIFFNITNLQWLLALGLIALLVSDDPRGFWAQLGDLAFTALAALSGPFSLLLAPLFVIRACLRRSPAAAGIALLVVSAAATQAWFIWHGPGSEIANPAPFRWAWVSPIVGLRLGTLFFPDAVISPSFRTHLWMGVIGGAVTGLAVFLSFRPGAERRNRLMLAACLGLTTAAAFFRYRQIQAVFLEPHISPRYFFVPQALLLWLLIANWSNGKIPGLIARGLFLAFLLVNLRGFRLSPFVDFHWRDYAAEIRAGHPSTFPVNPPGMTISCPAVKK